MAERLYTIHSMVREQSSRLQRKLTPDRHRAVLFFNGRRLIPGTPLSMHPADFVKQQDQIMKMVREGRIAITAPDGTFIDSKPDGTLYYRRSGEVSRLEERIEDVSSTGISSPPIVEETKAVVEAPLPAEEITEEIPPVEPAPIEEPKAEEVKEEIKEETTNHIVEMVKESEKESPQEEHRRKKNKKY